MGYVLSFDRTSFIFGSGTNKMTVFSLRQFPHAAAVKSPHNDKTRHSFCSTAPFLGFVKKEKRNPSLMLSDSFCCVAL
jgi:hypothetical protein